VKFRRPDAGLAASSGARGSPRGLRLQDDALAADAGYGGFVRTNSEVPAARQRPPLTKRLSPRHWAALDYVVGGVFGLILFTTIRRGVVEAIESPYGITPYRPLALSWPLAIFLVVMAVVAVGMRRRRPPFMLGVLLVGSVVVTMLTGPAVGALTYFLPVAYVLYLVAATYEHRRAAARVLIAVFATLLADAVLLGLNGGDVPNTGLISAALCVIIAWFTGYIVRQRRRYALGLQDEAASKAVAEERLRIARELHDVVAHSMSVIAVQAGYGQYVIDTQPADARNALGAIQATSREALDEMRRMLGALRQADESDQREVAARAGSGPAAGAEAGDPVRGLAGGPAGDAPGRVGAGAAPLSPAPGLADVDRLISRTASAGVRVDVTRCGQPRDLPASIDLSAYRIVQEALTNVVKHARTSSCRVLIGYGQDELILEVTDNGAGLRAMAGAGMPGNSLALVGGGPVPLAESSRPGWSAPDVGGSGHGIIGMRERVSLLGGEFIAGPLPGYGFQVSAHIPLPAGSA
jgi:signal transduction histidine kinase